MINMMMEYRYVCLLVLLSLSSVATSSHDDPSQGLEDNKLTGLLFRQAQDMGSIMTDVKTLIMLHSQQTIEINNMKTLIMLQTQQQENMMEKLEQQQRDTDDMKAQFSLQMQQNQRDLFEMKSLMQQQNENPRKDAALQGGCEGNITGLTTVYIKHSPVTVPCDGSGWVVIFRRVDNKYNFDTNGLSQYKHGSGNPTGSFFLGLDTIHRYTSLASAKLRVELEDWSGQESWAEYSYVHILGESQGYKLMVSGHTGTASDALSYHSGMKFSDMAQDNDFSSGSCANSHKAPWWHNQCWTALFTKEYTENGSGISWNYIGQKKVEMKIFIK